MAVQEAAVEELCDLSWGEFKPRLADAVCILFSLCLFLH